MTFRARAEAGLQVAVVDDEVAVLSHLAIGARPEALQGNVGPGQPDGRVVEGQCLRAVVEDTLHVPGHLLIIDGIQHEVPIHPHVEPEAGQRGEQAIAPVEPLSGLEVPGQVHGVLRLIVGGPGRDRLGCRRLGCGPGRAAREVHLVLRGRGAVGDGSGCGRARFVGDDRSREGQAGGHEGQGTDDKPRMRHHLELGHEHAPQCLPHQGVGRRRDHPDAGGLPQAEVTRGADGGQDHCQGNRRRSRGLGQCAQGGDGQGYPAPGQSGSQQASGPREPALGHALAPAQMVGGLLVGHVFQAAEHERLAESLGQPIDLLVEDQVRIVPGPGPDGWASSGRDLGGPPFPIAPTSDVGPDLDGDPARHAMEPAAQGIADPERSRLRAARGTPPGRHRRRRWDPEGFPGRRPGPSGHAAAPGPGTPVPRAVDISLQELGVGQVRQGPFAEEQVDVPDRGAEVRTGHVASLERPAWDFLPIRLRAGDTGSVRLFPEFLRIGSGMPAGRSLSLALSDLSEADARPRVNVRHNALELRGIHPRQLHAQHLLGPHQRAIVLGEPDLHPLGRQAQGEHDISGRHRDGRPHAGPGRRDGFAGRHVHAPPCVFQVADQYGLAVGRDDWVPSEMKE